MSNTAEGNNQDMNCNNITSGTKDSQNAVSEK